MYIQSSNCLPPPKCYFTWYFPFLVVSYSHCVFPFPALDAELKICHTLSSFSHFSRSCFRPCWRTGLHSSRDSNLFSWPWSNKMPKYCSNGEVWPGWVGTLWKRRMVSGVRRIPWSDKGDRSLKRDIWQNMCGQVNVTFEKFPCIIVARFSISAPLAPC